jgi:nucleoside-diphosphate-sugar epimerase
LSDDPRLITVFGGTGFIGYHLVASLLQGQHHVRLVTRRGAGAAPRHPRLTIVRAHLSDGQSLRSAVAGSSVVFHLATGGGPGWSDFAREVVEGTRLIGDACLHERVQRLVYTSSTAALYLGSSGTIDERAGTDPWPDRRNLYSRAKIAAERVLLEMHADRGLPVVIVRPAVVLGSGGTVAHAGFGAWPSDLCCVGWGSGNHPLPLVLVEDVVSALLALIDAPDVNGTSFNLAGDVRMSAREFISLVAQLSHRRYRFYPKPLVQLYCVDLAKWALKVVARKPENTFPSFRDLRSCSLRSELDCSAAKRRLGWRPVSDRQEFIARAILPHIKPLAPGDLRVA